jgi:hypothetical protein
MTPHRLPGGQSVAGDDLFLATLLLRVEEIAGDRERRPARSDRPPPHLDERSRRPVGLDAQAVNDAVAFGAAKATPFDLRDIRLAQGRLAGDRGYWRRRSGRRLNDRRSR